FSSGRRHTRFSRDWSSDVCSSDLHPAGGPADQIARLTGNGLGQALSATFVVDNRPGGGGMLGAQAVAQAKPDGETLLVNASVHRSEERRVGKECGAGWGPSRDHAW